MTADMTWAPEVVEAIMSGIGQAFPITLDDRELRPLATAALSASPLPEALDLIGRLVGADLVELCDKEGDTAAGAAASLARVRK